MPARSGFNGHHDVYIGTPPFPPPAQVPPFFNPHAGSPHLTQLHPHAGLSHPEFPIWQQQQKQQQQQPPPHPEAHSFADGFAAAMRIRQKGTVSAGMGPGPRLSGSVGGPYEGAPYEGGPMARGRIGGAVGGPYERGPMGGGMMRGAVGGPYERGPMGGGMMRGAVGGPHGRERGMGVARELLHVNPMQDAFGMRGSGTGFFRGYERYPS
jgi:hypothetical protein